MSVSLPSAKKNIAVIGNPGVGKTTFLVAAIHQLGTIGWAEIDLDSLPPDYAAAVDSMISGQPLAPTVGLNGYVFKFENFEYKGTEIKAGWFGNVTIRVTDLAGDDYRHSSALFRQSIDGAFSVLILIDPVQADTLPHSLAGQIGPLYNDIVDFVNEQIGPVLNIARRSDIEISMFEIDSRGKEGRLEPAGIEPVIYEALCFGCKVKGEKVDVEGPMQEM